MFKNNYSILLVDDENCARLLLGERISKMPNITVAASLPNGFTARKFLKEHVVDIVFTDIKMPLMDGLELAKFVKDFSNACPVAIISGHEEFEYARRAIQYGVKEYLLKPIVSKQIVELVERCCNEVDEKRKNLLLPQHYEYDKLEKSIYSAIIKGQESKEWIETLDQLIQGRGSVVRIEPLEVHERKKEEIAMIYKNVLLDALPGWIVLCLSYTLEKYEYLLLPQSLEEHRQLSSIPEYFDRVLKHSVKWTEVCSVETAWELSELYTSMKTEEGKVQIDLACRYIEENLSKMISRDDVADHVYLSPSYFSRLFKKIKGIGYNEYLTDLRIKKAKHMLCHNVSVADIAALVGFRDARYFSVIFQKKTGYTPSDYRRALRTGEISQEDWK